MANESTETRIDMIQVRGRIDANFCVSTHTNLTVRKIIEAMRTAYAKSGLQSQHLSNYTDEANDNGRQASIVKGTSSAKNISVFR